ncbi:MAG: alpha/beta fold hydrolase [Candidatus Shapirobacteria bacterium]|jgi:pimeloyl-ACP methyl ester carboxylesterase
MNDIVYVWTKDNLRLAGNHYESGNKRVGVLIVHGMSGNIIENYWGNVVGRALQKNGFGCVFSHNRGYNHINDIVVREMNEQNAFKSVRVGAVYERFEDSVYDIDAWYRHMTELGYKKIILMGHSLGCNKVTHYIYKKNPKNLAGVILLSPPDMVANAKESGESKIYQQLVNEAKKNIAEGNPRKLLTPMLWNWYNLSSQTFLDLFVDGCPADNLPLMRNPKSFPELESIKVPALAIVGEHDDIVVRSIEDDLSLLKEKAINIPSFERFILPGASHTYDNREAELSEYLIGWLKKNKF